MIKVALVLGYLFFLILYAFGTIFLLLKWTTDASGSRKGLAKTYAALFLLGGATSVPVYFAEVGLAALVDPFSGTIMGAFLDAFFIAAFTEEAFKFLVLLFVVRRRRGFARYADGLAFAAFVSLGFALVENVLYILFQGSAADSLQVAFMRSVTSIPGHFFDAIFMGYFVSLAILGKTKGVNILKDRETFRNASEKRRRSFVLRLFYAYGVAFLAHGLYDFLIMLGGTDCQLGGFAFVVCLLLLPLAFCLTREAIESFKRKDRALREAKTKPSMYRIGGRR